MWFGVVWKAVQLSDRVCCGSQGDFAGVVDLVKMKAIMWKSENLGTAPLLFVARVHHGRAHSPTHSVMLSLCLSLTRSLTLSLPRRPFSLRECSYEWCNN